MMENHNYELRSQVEAICRRSIERSDRQLLNDSALGIIRRGDGSVDGETHRPKTIFEDISMRLHQLTSPMTAHRGIVLLLSTVFLASLSAQANAQYAGVTTYLGSYSSPAPTRPANLEDLVTDMKKGGYVIVFRHGATNADQADTDPFHLDNIGAQRLLSDKGRDVAKRVGDSFRRLGIPLGKVYSSEFNRATETAELVSGRSPTTTADLTEGGLVVSPAENARRANALKALAVVVPEAGSNTLIVTHKPNILDAFGEDWFASKEGEASVFRPDGSNNLVLVARVQAAEWISLAGGK
jgi:phosphohistidine phosphatase SixA